MPERFKRGRGPGRRPVTKRVRWTGCSGIGEGFGDAVEEAGELGSGETGAEDGGLGAAGEGGGERCGSAAGGEGGATGCHEPSAGCREPAEGKFAAAAGKMMGGGSKISSEAGLEGTTTGA